MKNSSAKNNSARKKGSSISQPEQALAATLRFLGKIDRDPSALRAAKKLEERGRKPKA